MSKRERPLPQSKAAHRIARALGAAGLAAGAIGIIVGIGGLVWLHTSSYSHAASGAGTAVTLSSTETGSQEFLHAPASWPSVPRADVVFANQPGAPVDDAPAPTF